MPTQARQARGRPNRLIACDSCGRPESLGHIVQQCPRTHGQRVKRHDNIVDFIIKKVSTNNKDILKEPPIPTSAGVRKPDIIIINRENNTSIVLDITICADNTPDIDEVRQRKIVYYQQPEIINWIKTTQRTDNVEFDAVVLNWRGAIAPKTFQLLTNKLKMNKKDIELMSVKTLEGTYTCWLAFKKSTFKV